MFVTLECAISSLAAAEWLNDYNSKGRCSHLPCGTGWSRTRTQKCVGRCSTSTTPLKVSGKGSPLPTCAPQTEVGTLFHTLRWSHGCCEERGPPERKDRAGSSCSMQHSTFCRVGFPAGNLYSCFSLGKSAISPSPSVPALAAGESLPWGRHRGDRKAGVGESSVCQEGKSDTFLK